MHGQLESQTLSANKHTKVQVTHECKAELKSISHPIKNHSQLSERIK